jgi:hypothetical protein
MKKLLKDGLLFKLLEKMDSEMADAAEAEGCDDCGEEKLHHGDFPRKPRGGSRRWNKRRSFCCAKKGCRKRKTPPSVRFLGRKVYAGVVVVLVSAMMHGLKPKRVELLREALNIDKRTLERWRTWWLENFADSRFWKSARARFVPRLIETILPLSLVDAFKAKLRAGMARLLEFISPITISARKGAAAM